MGFAGSEAPPCIDHLNPAGPVGWLMPLDRTETTPRRETRSFWPARNGRRERAMGWRWVGRYRRSHGNRGQQFNKTAREWERCSLHSSACVGSTVRIATPGVGSLPTQAFWPTPRSGEEHLYRPPGADRSLRRRKLANGELLLGITILEVLQFGLVLALGLLPLAIVLVADPPTSLKTPQIARRIQRPGWARTGILAVFVHWLVDWFS